MATRAALLCALVAVLAAILNLTTSSPYLCSRPSFPDIEANKNPLEQNKGKVVLVALTKASCTMCREHIRKLDALVQDLRDMGMVETAFVIVAKYEHQRWLSKLSHETPSKVYVDAVNGTLFKGFEGTVNDVLIYDRCGKMAYFVPWPEKDKVKGIISLVENALSRTYTMDVCPGICHPPKPIPTSESLAERFHQELKNPLKIVTSDTMADLEAEVNSTASNTSVKREGKKNLWTYFKSFLGYDESAQEKNIPPPSTTPQPFKVMPDESISREEACRKLGKNHCGKKKTSPKVIKREHFCCSLVHDGETNGTAFHKKCSRFHHTVRYCTKIALIDVCCGLEIETHEPEICKFECYHVNATTANSSVESNGNVQSGKLKVE